MICPPLDTAKCWPADGLLEGVDIPWYGDLLYPAAVVE
jgi:hypothetical protein